VVGKRWRSGKVRDFDQKTEMGIIEDDDGEPMVFHLSEVMRGIQPKQGALVHFEADVTKMGMFARKITVLEEE
jgi:cold shock CspA family protein